MNKRLKLLIMILIAVVQFSFITNISAINVNNTTLTGDSSYKYITDQGTITVNNVDASDSLKAYKILDVYYNSQTNTIKYDFTTSFRNFLNTYASDTTSVVYTELYDTTKNEFSVDKYLALTSGSTNGSSQSPSSTLDQIMSLFANYSTLPTANNLTVSNGSAVSGNLDVGTYFVYPDSSTKIYAVMVGNIEEKVFDGNWSVQNAIINAKATEATVNKTAGKDYATKASEASYGVGETYTNYIDIVVPQYPTNAPQANKTLSVSETINTDHFNYDPSSLVVKDGGNSGTQLTVEYDSTNHTGTVKNGSNETVATFGVSTSGNTDTLSFIFDISKINSTNVLISYEGSLANGAVRGGTSGNPSTATLTYVKDVYATSPQSAIASSTSTVYTYDLKIVKRDGSDNTIKLNGATFKLCTTQACSNANEVVQDNITTATVSSENGVASILGVAEGTYYLIETQAPAGYNLTAPIPVTVARTDGAEQTINVDDVKASGLPFTGGMGTIIYTLAGVAVVLIVSIIFIVYKRKKDKDNQR